MRHFDSMPAAEARYATLDRKAEKVRFSSVLEGKLEEFCDPSLLFASVLAILPEKNGEPWRARTYDPLIKGAVKRSPSKLWLSGFINISYGLKAVSGSDVLAWL